MWRLLWKLPNITLQHHSRISVFFRMEVRNDLGNVYWQCCFPGSVTAWLNPGISPSLGYLYITVGVKFQERLTKYWHHGSFWIWAHRSSAVNKLASIHFGDCRILHAAVPHPKNVQGSARASPSPQPCWVPCLVFPVVAAHRQDRKDLAPFGYAQRRSSFTALPSVFPKTQQVTVFRGHISRTPLQSSVILSER